MSKSYLQAAGSGGGAIVEQVSSSVLAVDEDNSVPASVQTTITTYTASGSKKITKIIVSGQGNARWDVYIDSVRQFTIRASNGDRTQDVNFFNGWPIASSSTIDIKATHYFNGKNLAFEATIYGY